MSSPLPGNSQILILFIYFFRWTALLTKSLILEERIRASIIDRRGVIFSFFRIKMFVCLAEIAAKDAAADQAEVEYAEAVRNVATEVAVQAAMAGEFFEVSRRMAVARVESQSFSESR